MDAELPLDLYAASRWLGYLALFTAIGACTFRPLVQRTLGAGDPMTAHLVAAARRLAAVAAAALVLTSLFRMYFQARSALDPGDALTWGSVTDWFSGLSSWGGRWAMQTIAAVALVAGFGLARARRAGWVLASAAAGACVLTEPLTGHAVEHAWGVAAGLALHALHLLGGGIWLGTLFVLLVTALGSTRGEFRHERERVVAALVHGYSPLALAGAGTAVGLGVVLAWLDLGSLAALWTTIYGRALLVKVVLLTGVAALGAYNWRRVRPALGAERGARRLRLSATMELIIGVLLLATTAVLVALPAPAL